MRITYGWLGSAAVALPVSLAWAMCVHAAIQSSTDASTETSASDETAVRRGVLEEMVVTAGKREGVAAPGSLWTHTTDPRTYGIQLTYDF